MTNYKRIYFCFTLKNEQFSYGSARAEATNYFRLMTPSVDKTDSNELVTQRPVASLTDGLAGRRVASATGVCLFGYGKHSWLWESISFGN